MKKAVAPFTILDLDGNPSLLTTIPVHVQPKARSIPVDAEGHTRTFEQIARGSDLGFLKLDGDNLGWLLSYGLRESGDGDNGRDRSSISRISGLSRQLEGLFGGYVEHLLRHDFTDVYLVYSGGDDLVALGPWERMFDFCMALRHAVDRFSGGNPRWSLSAGLCITGLHVPVLDAVESAETLLEKAKNATGSGITPIGERRGTGAGEGATPAKNRLAVFDTIIPFDLLSSVVETARGLVRWINAGALSKAHLYRLLDYGHKYAMFQLTGVTEYLEYAPLLVRDIRRNWNWARPTAEQREARAWARGLGTELDGQGIRSLKFVCQYAVKATRRVEG
jgi:CRISPR-associated protein Csm1